MILHKIYLFSLNVYTMPSMNLLSRLYRKKATTLVDDGSSTGPKVMSELIDPQSEHDSPRTSFPSPFERRIHPNLNALAAELSSDIQDTRHSNETFPLPRDTLSQTDLNIPFVPLTPWIRNRTDPLSVTLTPTQITNTATQPQESLTEEPISINTSIDVTPDSNVSPTPSNERPESRANRIFNRLTGLGVRASPTPNPPSAWNTFGRRRSRRHNSIPHASDFGASPDVSLSNSQRSRASSNQTSPWYATETSADMSGSLSMSLQSITHSYSRSQSQSQFLHTPSHIHSPPSSAFTFGAVNTVYGQPSSTASPTYPALRFSMFGGDHGEVPAEQIAYEEEENDTSLDLNQEPLSQPRTSSSMPSLSQQRTLDLVLQDSVKSGTGPTRPRAQDIFPASTSLDQLSTLKGYRRRKTNKSSATGSDHSSRRKRKVIRNLREAFPRSPAEVSGSSETCADNVSTNLKFVSTRSRKDYISYAFGLLVFDLIILRALSCYITLLLASRY
ncbi:hypothetical protein J3R30DRAFT_2180832 [Lentinula aciculospora]|uniref:Uncharacterized protein n=1 Tax=Lentinula aciculospora TaxID=153920 RepID=A0A9W9AGT8_9AGAR|nr:hypothetical protein J3R30DRAFT_2180832 [Lentinula aciculospora]